MMKSFLISISCMISLSVSAFAATIRVPDDYKTLGEAETAAHDGDEIVFSPGKYSGGSIHKRLTIRSTFDGKDWSIVENTRIDRLKIPIDGKSGVVISGIHIGYDRETAQMPGIMAIGISSVPTSVTVQFCIIEYCAQRKYPDSTYGAGLIGVKGIIQNNIIRNNFASGGSAMYECEGIVRNNVFYNNLGGNSIECGMCDLINNTIVNSSDVSVGAAAKVINNIMWRDSRATATSRSIYSGPGPRNCLIKSYTGPGTGIITSDPKFVDPLNGDFHLQSSSPCIDAGITTQGLKADLVGVQRGLKGVSTLRGDGSGTDIGAFEYIPKPVAVWFPNGGPSRIQAGDNVAVAWQLDMPPAGTTINLQLYDGTAKVADFGNFSNSKGTAESIIKLPTTIQTRSTYTILGVSVWNRALFFKSPVFGVNNPKNAVPYSVWGEVR